MISALLQRRQSAAAKRWWRERFVVGAAANTLYGMVALRLCLDPIENSSRGRAKNRANTSP